MIWIVCRCGRILAEVGMEGPDLPLQLACVSCRSWTEYLVTPAMGLVYTHPELEDVRAKLEQMSTGRVQ